METHPNPRDLPKGIVSNDTNITDIQIDKTNNEKEIELMETSDIQVQEDVSENLVNENQITASAPEKVQHQSSKQDLIKANITSTSLETEEFVQHSVSEETPTVTKKEIETSSEGKPNLDINEEKKGNQSPDLLFYNWDVTPKLLCVAKEEYKPTEFCENFTKGCQWSPDGTCLLVPSEDFRLRVYELPRELYAGKVNSTLTFPELKAVLTIKDGGLIYDTCWYPFMSSWEPETCCFLSTSQESPAHLWDAFNGELRATYRAYNLVDEVEAAISVQFINSAMEVWCGFKNALRIFDTERPGRQRTDIFLKKDFPNTSGIVSCIRESPTIPGLVAFGSYSKCIGLYKDGPICVFKTGSGVTQVEFSPCGMKLYSAERRSDEFLCWDLRNPGKVLCSFKGRRSDTNQRIQFTVSSITSNIVSGGTDGFLSVWEDAVHFKKESDPIYKIRMSKDCINGVSLHKTLPIVAVSTGQRIYESWEDTFRDNSVCLWWYGKITEE